MKYQIFVDINQQSVEVNRFDIVKALYQKDPLLQQVFKLIADKQKRGEDNLSLKQTTDPAKRKNREDLFVQILEALP